MVKKVSVPIRKQKRFALAVRIAHQERRRYAAADAAGGAIAVHFTGAGVHHAEVALAVDDFAGKLYFTEFHIGKTTYDFAGAGNGLALDFQHVVDASNDSLSRERYLAAVKSSHVGHAMLSRPNQ
jgi:hypothetical protein